MLRSIAYEAKGPVGVATTMVKMLSGIRTQSSRNKVNNGLIALIFFRLICGECGPCPVFASYTLAFALQLRKSTENLSQSSRKLPAGTIQCVRKAALRVAWTSCRSQLPCCRGPGSTLGQRRCLPSCSTKKFPTSANLKSNLSVRDLTWSEK